MEQFARFAQGRRLAGALRALAASPRELEGRRGGAHYLIEIGRNEARWESAGLVGLSKGWAIGTAGWRKTLAKEYGQLALQPGLHREEVAEIREGAWEAALKCSKNWVATPEN